MSLRKMSERPKSSSTPNSVTDASPSTDVNTSTSPLMPLSVLAVLAALATYLFAVRGPSAVSSVLPASYGICTLNSTIYTVDPDKPNVECILVHRDSIMTTGSLDYIKSSWDTYQNELIATFFGNEPTAKKPLPIYYTPSNAIIVPGLADAHCHLVHYGLKAELPLDQAYTLDGLLDMLETYIRAHPDLLADPTLWVQGMGWDHTRWGTQFPTSDDLATRPLLNARPIVLTRIDAHAIWLSPRALALTLPHLPAAPSDPAGGQIIRDAQGNPTGVLLDAAMALAPVPPPSHAQIRAFAEHALRDAVAVGLTSVHDAAADENVRTVLEELAEEGRLLINVYAMASSEASEYWGDGIQQLENFGKGGRLNMRSVKLFTDGALGSWGAALLEPYSDNPDTSGVMRSEPAALRELILRFWDDGWGVNVHCIGDRANKVVLDIFEELLEGDDSANARRPRIEHAQIMQLTDLERAGRLGVLTSVQPTHATSDMWYAETRLGSKRITGAYAYNTLLQAARNNILPLGSDFPVENINPLLGFYAAVARLDIHGNSPHGPDGWFPAERLTRAQALKGMTLDAAYAAFTEETRGSLVPGKKADFVVLDRDIMAEDAPMAEILKTRVYTTVIDGRIVYGKV